MPPLHQIGIMFMEVALGLQVLALIHFAGNAIFKDPTSYWFPLLWWPT